MTRADLLDQSGKLSLQDRDYAYLTEYLYTAVMSHLSFISGGYHGQPSSNDL